MGEVVDLGAVFYGDLPPARILTDAQEADLEDVIVVGCQKDGSLYFAFANADATMALWLLEKAKIALLQELE